jgi:hypothetical protein
MPTTDVPSPQAAPSVSERLARAVPLGTAVLALLYLGPALWIVLAPHSFFDQIGPFGAYNAHYLGDAAAFQGGIGLGLAAAVRWPALRTGALAVALASTALHAINHWIDVNAAHAGTNAGISDALSLTVLALFTAVLLRAAMRETAS